MNPDLRAAAEAIRRANRIVLATHVNPDGDTLGSALALAHAFRRMHKHVTILSHDGVPEIYRWMPGQEWVQRDTELRDHDLAIVCDTGTVERIGRARPAVEAAPVSLNIDHHTSEGSFGQIRVVDPKAAATGELIYALLRTLRSNVDKAIANCLMCAIVTDTGSFRYMNVTPNTFRIAGVLIRRGACPSAISELVFENRSLASVKLLGRALDSLQTSLDGRITWAHIRASDFVGLNATDEETEGIVNHVRAIRGSSAAALFREVPDKKVRISLRSRDGFDVNEIAQTFGGGGHRLAAGCTLDPPLEETERKVIGEIERVMKETGN